MIGIHSTIPLRLGCSCGTCPARACWLTTRGGLPVRPDPVPEPELTEAGLWRGVAGTERVHVAAVQPQLLEDL